MTLARWHARLSPTGRGGFAVARWARSDIPRDRWDGRFTPLPGVTLDLDLATYPDCCMATGSYELETRRTLARLLQPGGHLVDCGANLGFFTVVAARMVGSTGRVDAIEPDPGNRRRLADHVALNGLTNVTIHPVAAAATSGVLTLYQPSADLNHGQASGYPALVPGGHPVEVRSDRLDHLVQLVPDVVKLDVEGAELEAVRGADRFWCADRPPAVVFEHNPQSAAAAGFRSSDLIRHLMALQPRYRASWVDWRLTPIRDLARLDAEPRQRNVLVRCFPR